MSYTFSRDTIVKNIFDESVTGCNIRTFNDFDAIVFCIFVGISYIVGYLAGSKFKITTSRISEFEGLFPEFPYYKANCGYKQIVEMITVTNDRIDKLVSYLETIMIVLGQRKASEDNLDI